MNLTALFTILYIVVVMAVGFLASRRKGGVREFFVAGGQLPWMLLVPFLLAEFISSGTTVGVAEKAHKDGISILFLFAGAPVGLTLVAFVFVRFYHSIKKISVGEALLVLFDSKTKYACVTAILVGSMIASGTASLALATIVAPMFNISYAAAVWVSITFMVALGLLGLRGQAWMNVIHLFTVIVCFTTVAVAAMAAAGGWGNVAASLPAGHLNPAQAGWPKIGTWFFSTVAIYQISLISITAMFASRSETDAKVAALMAGIGVLVFTLLPAAIGLAAKVIAPRIDSKLALWTMGEHLGSWATIMISLGVFAAIVSTTPGFILSMGMTFTRDYVLPLKQHLSDKAQINISRLVIVVIGFLGTWLAFRLGEGSTIIELGNKTVQLRTIIVVPFLVSVLWRRLNPTATFWAVVSGVLTGLIWFFTGSPLGIEPMWLTLGVGIPVLIVASLFKKPAPYKGGEGLEPVPRGRPGDS